MKNGSDGPLMKCNPMGESILVMRMFNPEMPLQNVIGMKECTPGNLGVINAGVVKEFIEVDRGDRTHTYKGLAFMPRC